jgi:YjbR
MSHPLMFDENDPILLKLRAVALALPSAAEKVSHGRPTFFTKKVFAYFGGSVRHGDGDWTSHDHSVLVLLDRDEHRAASQDPRFFIPAYHGPSGWLGLDLGAHTDWDEVAELLESSFRQTAPPKLIAQLETLR